MYLFEYMQGDGDVTEIIDAIADGYGFTVSERPNGDDVTHGIYLSTKGNNMYGDAYLSEFPGNCCALVLHNIQKQANAAGKLDPAGEALLNTALEMCERMEYALLFISGTHPRMKDRLIKEYGFSGVLDNIFNPHSGQNNFFLVKRIDWSKDDEEEEEDDEEDDT